jgi:diacylglycerol kinase family enzyme
MANSMCALSSDADESSKIAYQIDGDYGGTLPVEVEILPGDLRLLVSQDAARRLGFELPTTQ